MSEDPESADRSARVIIALGLSVVGLLFHNWWDLPDLTLLSPENSGPLLVGLALGLLAWWKPHSSLTHVLLLWWGVAHLIGGGIVSVVPFEFLPFYPEQSVRHYFGHLVYIAMQIPLLVLALRHLRTPSSEIASCYE